MVDIRELGNTMANHVENRSAALMPSPVQLAVTDATEQQQTGYVWCDYAGATVRCLVPNVFDLSSEGQIIWAYPMGSGATFDYICIGVAWNGVNGTRVPNIVVNQIVDTGGGSLGGTVTSVGLSASPAGIFDVASSPVTSSGTIALSMDNQNANIVLAGPSSGGAATPAFRSLVADDIPSLNASKINAGTLALARGGANADLSATGPGVLTQATNGANVTVVEADRKLATVGSIDAKTVAATTLFTVPGGLSMVVTKVIIRVTAFTVGSKSVQAVASFGGNAATYDDYLNSVTYTVTASGKAIADSVLDAEYPIYAAASDFKISIETGSDATTETWAVDLFGYLL